MAFTNRFSSTDFIKMVHTGNTLGMAQSPAQGAARFETFVSLDPNLDSGKGVPSSFDPNTFAGTTDNWPENGSWARLDPDASDVPPGSTVEYALLVWAVQRSGTITETLIDTTTITLGLPDATTVPITVDPTFSDNSGVFYTRAREITGIVQGLPNSGFGDYSLSGVPTQGPSGLGAGWSIIYVYKNQAMPLRNINIYTGFLNNNQSTNVSGFLTPTSGVVDARVYTMAQWGDSDFAGDFFRLNGTPLSGPRNPSNNFFASQVNDYLGNSALISSFGDRNVTPGQNPANQKAEFDVTNVDATGILPNGATSTTVSITGTADVIVSNALGVEINSNSANLTSIKEVDPTVAALSETLTYTIAIENTGSVTAEQVVFTDTIPPNTTFITNSLTIDGITQVGVNPENGVTIPNLAGSGGVSTVTFQVLAPNFIPSPNPIPNSSTTSYIFEPIPGGGTIFASTESNEVNTLMLDVNLDSNKAVDLNYADFGDTITYTIILENTGQTNIENIVFVDTIPSGTTFITNSLTLNGVVQPGINPQSGLNIGSLSFSEVATITFQVNVDNNFPSPNPVPNVGYFGYEYFGVTDTISDGLTTNTVDTQVNHGEGTAVKSTDKELAAIGDTLAYTIVLTNTGNVDMINVLLTDLVPLGADFISGTVEVDGVSQPSDDPALGISVGTIPVGASSTVTFQVEVVDIPVVDSELDNQANIDFEYVVDPSTPDTTLAMIDSNIVTTTVTSPILDLVKSTDKDVVAVPGTLTYTLVITNSGNTTANNVTVLDTIPDGTTFIPDSLTLNGVTQPGENPNPPTGFTISSLSVNEVATITFQVAISSIPSVNPVPNFFDTTYDFTLTSLNDRSGRNTSNTVTTTFSKADLSGITKSVDRSFADCGETLTYTIIVPNSGNLTALNVIFTDTIPNGTAFVNNSITINGVTQPGANPESGVNIGAIGIGETSTLTFQVLVDCS